MEETPEERAARILRRHETNKKKIKHIEGTTSMAKMARELNIVQKFLRQIAAVGVWLWWNFGNPLFNNFTMPFIKFFFSWYINLWNRFALVKDEFGQPRLSYKRGGAMVVGTLFAAFMSIHVVVFSFEATLYGLSKREEVIYLSFPQEIDPANNVFSVQGCEFDDDVQITGEMVCDEDNSWYFRVYPSGFHQAWSLVSRGRVFFSDQVVSSIGANWSRCDVITYGYRFKLLMFLADIFPVLLSARCTPLSAANARPSGV